MPTYDVNEDAVSQARRLIDDGKVDVDTPWSDAAPSTDEENDEIDEHDHKAFGAWHLAVDPDASEGTKERYAFPYGDFQVVNRAALVHAKQRASQYGHDKVEAAADALLDRLDDKQGN